MNAQQATNIVDIRYAQNGKSKLLIKYSKSENDVMYHLGMVFEHVE